MTRSPGLSRAVSSTRYMFASGRSRRTRRHTSGPSSSGIIQSRIASVGTVAARRYASARAPSPTVATSKSQRFSVRDRISAVTRSSSATSARTDPPVTVSAGWPQFFAVAKKLPAKADKSAPASMTPVRLRRLGAATLAGLAGVALNLLPLAAVARLFPGRVATLPIAMVYGPWYGAVAAVFAALPLARSQPLVIVVFGLEALMIGVFARRGK